MFHNIISVIHTVSISLISNQSSMNVDQTKKKPEKSEALIQIPSLSFLGTDPTATNVFRYLSSFHQVPDLAHIFPFTSRS